MDKSSYQLAVNPVARVSAVSASASIGSTVQSLESRASHLAHHHAALMAQITAASSGAEMLQKMGSTADVSATAQLIHQSLTQAEASGLASKFIAQTVLTHTPALPNVVSQQLKTAINQSGLFYESHLQELVEGRRSVDELKQEPQNKPHHVPHTLLPQQLHILEHQRLSWHGEVWPGQPMDWDLYRQDAPDNKEHRDDTDEPAATVSELSLQLPHLGKVTAKIHLKNGRMQIALLAEQENALRVLKEKSPALASAIESKGQQLESLTLNRATQMLEVAPHV